MSSKIKYSVNLKLFLYDALAWCSSRRWHGKYNRKHPDSTVFCKTMVHNAVTKLCSIRSILDKNKS